MNKTRQIIEDNRDKFPEFQYYIKILDKIEENIELMPDVAIESCKALFEGVSKTILKKMEISYTEGGRNADDPRSLLKKVLNNIPYIISHEPEFINKACALVTRVTEIRNERGDISHGKLSPKEDNSSINLAEFIAHVTDSTIKYILNIYFNADFSYLEEMKYEDNDDFNQFLDDEKILDGILYSRALFDQDMTSYKEQLADYLENKEDEKLID